MLKHSLLCCSIILLSGINASAQSQKPPSSWNLHQYTLTLTGFPVPKDMKRIPFSAETIYTDAPDEGDVAITCLREKLYLSVEAEPMDFKAFVVENKDSRRARYRAVTVRVDGEKVSRNKWTYILEHKILLARKRTDTHKIYNAAISGKPVTLQMGNGKTFALNLPKPNSTFADFGANCGIGRNKS